jgi:hypothetical protein
LFKKNWYNIKSEKTARVKQGHLGTFHYTKDKELYQHLLKNGFETSVAEIIQYGKDKGLWKM